MVTIRYLLGVWFSCEWHSIIQKLSHHLHRGHYLPAGVVPIVDHILSGKSSPGKLELQAFCQRLISRAWRFFTAVLKMSAHIS